MMFIPVFVNVIAAAGAAIRTTISLFPMIW